MILGRTILEEVKKDISVRKLPSHIGRPPTHPGEKAWGKFTADQWKTFCTVHLPYTLTRLWGPLKNSDDPQERRRYHQLTNFLDLVTAVKIATAKTQTEKSIQEYEVKMRAYLQKLLELYPGSGISPYQHLSLHFGELLRLFGPNHAWRCWAFERYNGIIQKISTNNIFGEMSFRFLEH